MNNDKEKIICYFIGSESECLEVINKINKVKDFPDEDTKSWASINKVNEYNYVSLDMQSKNLLSLFANLNSKIVYNLPKEIINANKNGTI